MSRLKSFVFTVNNYTNDDIERIKTIPYKYLVFGKELAPSTGTPHLQGYMQLPNARTFKSLKKAFPSGAHLERARGSGSSNRDYCIKDGDFFEDGDVPQQGKRFDLDIAKEIAMDDRPCKMQRITQQCGYQAIRTAEKVLTYNEAKRQLDKPPEVIWVYGPSGSGKSRYVNSETKEDDPYYLTTGKWWEGYDGHKVVVFDDFREDQIPFSQLLRILDLYPHRVEFKGGARQLLADKFYITTILSPEQFKIPRGEDRTQLLRRITKTVSTISQDVDMSN